MRITGGATPTMHSPWCASTWVSSTPGPDCPCITRTEQIRQRDQREESPVPNARQVRTLEKPESFLPGRLFLHDFRHVRQRPPFECRQRISHKQRFGAFLAELRCDRLV